MGYDIYTVEANVELAEYFARKYQYGYLFDIPTTTEQMLGSEPFVIPDDAKFDGDGRVYFRSNIWGMAPLRHWMSLVCQYAGGDVSKYEELITKVSFNQGDIITPEEIEMLFNDMDKISDDQISLLFEEMGERPHLLTEWIDYLEVAAKLGGAMVW